MNKRDKLSNWLVGSKLAAFGHDTSFEVKVVHYSSEKSFGSEFLIRWSELAFFGTPKEWDSFCKNLPLQPKYIELDRAAQSLMLACFLGEEITGIRVSEDGDMIIHLMSGVALTIMGAADDFDFSGWSVVRIIDPDTRQGEEISCDASGLLHESNGPF